MRPKFRIISDQELKNEINIIDYMGDLCGNNLYVNKVIFIEDDLKIVGNLTMEYINELDSQADFMLIKGNLIINGDMNPLEETFPNMLVLGNMLANNIQNGEELVVINGNVMVTNLIFGNYNHGALKVNGTVTAKYVINNDHMMLLPNLFATYIISPFLNKANAKSDLLPYNMFKEDILEKTQNDYLTQEEGWNPESNQYENMMVVDIDKLALDIKQNMNIFGS